MVSAGHPPERILLLIARQSNRQQLAKFLSDRYEVQSKLNGSVSDALENCDLCIIDDTSFNRYRTDLIENKDSAEPEFLPYLLVMTSSTANGFREVPWDVVDEAIQTPIRKTELQARIAVLLRARGYSLELSRQNQRLKNFADILVHDLRNPLSIAKGRLEMVQTEDDGDHLDTVSKAHNRMEVLIDDVLSLARGGRTVTEPEVVELQAIAQEAWRNVSTAQSTLSVTSERSIHADQSRLQQVLENLMRNAVEHAGADVEMTVGDLSDGFYVEDDGPGIPEAERADIFETGYTTNEQGTGFGLGIVKEIVEAHGWAVRVINSSTGGARFEFTGVDISEA